MIEDKKIAAIYLSIGSILISILLFNVFFIISGFMHQSTAELTFDEQVELNQAIISKIEKRLPAYNTELEKLKKSQENCKHFKTEQMQELKERDSHLDKLQEQESEKMELMLEWLNHRIRGVSQFSYNSSELFALKTKISNLKSK